MSEIGIIGILVVIIIILVMLLSNSYKKNASIQFSKQSQSVKYGQMSEQFMPFIKEYPYDSQDFKFIGKPIDGIQFCDDKIVFIEFKINTSMMTETQRNIKDLIERKKVYFEEIRLR